MASAMNGPKIQSRMGMRRGMEMGMGMGMDCVALAGAFH